MLQGGEIMDRNEALFRKNEPVNTLTEVALSPATAARLFQNGVTTVGLAAGLPIQQLLSNGVGLDDLEELIWVLGKCCVVSEAVERRPPNVGDAEWVLVAKLSLSPSLTEKFRQAGVTTLQHLLAWFDKCSPEEIEEFLEGRDRDSRQLAKLRQVLDLPRIVCLDK